jgi:hypothetical protein
MEKHCIKRPGASKRNAQDDERQHAQRDHEPSATLVCPCGFVIIYRGTRSGPAPRRRRLKDKLQSAVHLENIIPP